MINTKVAFESERESGQMGRRQAALLVVGWIGSLGSVGALLAAGLRGLAPNLLDEPNQRFRIGQPEDYADGSITFVEEIRVFVLRNGNAFRTMSAICTHLGCTVNRVGGGEGYLCPCHGSRFDANGLVIKGPAPRPLPWLDMKQTRDGRLLIDRGRTVEASSYLVLEGTEEASA
ncbi:MAG: ubiquinol-cytochrome c reductase iron-sulfur subunit [Thermoanaerobaculales bacterium]